MTSAARRGADALVQTLADAGVTRIFSLSGNQIMPIYDACIDAGIRIVHTRHEASAVFMADAWAQLTGETGIALVTAAPGFANAVGALYTARASESPILLISGDAPVGADGKGAFQDLDQVAVSAPLTKRSQRVTDAADMASAVRAALHETQSGRPGPVHLAVPFDVVNADAGSAAPTGVAAAVRQAADAETAGYVAGALAQAARPLILTGPSLNRTRAGALFAALERSTGAPILAMESPRGLNDPCLGRLGTAIAEADLVVALGKRIDYTLAFASAGRVGHDAKWIVIDAEEGERAKAERNLGERARQIIAADPRVVAEALAGTAQEASAARREWAGRIALLTGERAFETSANQAGDGSLTSLTLCQGVARRMAACERSLLVADGGEFGQWAQAVLRGDERLVNGPSGAIGGSLCYAVAAAMARPDATVFALMGDGTAGFQFAEFETAAREGVRFVAVIGNDACWNAEHQIQLREYGPDRLIGCDLSPARYDIAAAGLGCHGEFVTDAADLDAALARAVAADRPACVNVRITGLPAPTLGGPSAK